MENKRNRKGIVCMIIGLLLIAAALCLTMYNMWDNKRAAENVQKGCEAVEQEIAKALEITRRAEQEVLDEGEIWYPDYVLNPDMDMPEAEIDGWTYIGVLEIPSLELSLPIISQWSYAALRVAPCRYVGSVYNDSMVIAAHNYASHFGNLKNISIGDEVRFTDMDGNVFYYEAAELEVLEPTAIEDMTAGDWDLSLFTCTIGGQYRVTVRCLRKN